MTDEINVLHRDQTIFVEPASGAISVISSGPPGATGPAGPPGAASTVPGPPGAGTDHPLGIIASGNQVVTPAVNSVLNLSSVIRGPASWLAANTITLPAGGDGLYIVVVDVQYRSDNVVGIKWDVCNSAGTPYTPAFITGISHSPSSWDCRIQSSWVRQCFAGDTFQVRTRGNAMQSPGYMWVQRFAIVRLGLSLA